MPLGDFEREVLGLLAANRHPDSVVGGATVLHQNSDSPRASRDVDLFHNTAESWAVLETAGYSIEFVLEEVTCRRALVRRGGRETQIEWVQDSAFRALFAKLPPAEMGCFCLDASGKPVCPDPAWPDFARLIRHFGSVKGAWPRLVES